MFKKSLDKLNLSFYIMDVVKIKIQGIFQRSFFVSVFVLFLGFSPESDRGHKDTLKRWAFLVYGQGGGIGRRLQGLKTHANPKRPPIILDKIKVYAG